MNAYRFHGIEPADDDIPVVPSCSPLDSAQAKRAARLPVTIEAMIPHRSAMLNSCEIAATGALLGR